MTMRLEALTATTSRLAFTGDAHVRDSMRTVLDIARELASRIECDAAGLRWWCDAIAWRDREARPDERNTWRSLATLARDAGILTSRVMSGRIDEAELARCLELLTADKDRVYGRILRIAEDGYRERDQPMVNLLSLAPEGGARDGIRDSLANLWTDIATIERARGPLVASAASMQPSADAYVRPSVDATPSAPLVREPRGFMPQECAACGHRWTPRVAMPRKCPRCQRYFAYESGEARG